MQRRFRVREFNWPVHWQGHRDNQRHRDRLERAFREGDKASIGREILTVREEGKTIRIAFQFLRQHGFEFDSSTGVQLGHFQKSFSQLSETRRRINGFGDQGPGAGGEEGVREVWKSNSPDSDCAYQDWTLPCFSSIGDNHSVQVTPEPLTRGPLDAKRTLLANLARNSRGGKGEIREINKEDLRYLYPIPDYVREKVPVVFLLQDVSNSMGETCKSLSKYGFFIIADFLRNSYPQACPVFIIHDVAARQVTREEFFSVSGCGGTKCASAYRLMLETIRGKHFPDNYVFYGIHISDGNIQLRDGLECRGIAREFLGLTLGFAYFQVGDKRKVSADSLAHTMLPLLGDFPNGAFLVEGVSTREEMAHGLSQFFRNYPNTDGSSHHG